MSCTECSLSASHNPKRPRPHSWHCTEYCRTSPQTSTSGISDDGESSYSYHPQNNHTIENSTKFQLGLFEVDYTIGIGNYSVVKHAIHRILRNEVAIKIVDKTKLDKDSLSRVTREIEILKRLRHPFVIHLYQIIETDTHLYIVTEYASKGELYEYIKGKKRLDEDEARRLFWQLFSAVEYCHQHGVSHRDIKAENVLIDSSGRLKLADFGFSNFHAKDYYSRTFCGSPPYAAPEIFNGTAYLGAQADSLGVTLYVMATGTMPFSGAVLPELKTKVLHGQFRIPYYMSTELEHLLRRMMCVDAKRRISIFEIANHPWMRASSNNENIRQEISAFQIVTNGDATVACVNIMKRLGVPVEKINSSLHSMEYDHAMCLFLLLMERYRKRNFDAALTMIKEKEDVEKGIYAKTELCQQSSTLERGSGRPLLKQLRGHSQFGTTDTVSSVGTTSSSMSRQSTNTVDSVDEGVDFSMSADAHDSPYHVGIASKKLSEIKQTSVNGSEGAIMATRMLKGTTDDFRASENNVADSFPTGNIGDRTNEIASMDQPAQNESVSQRMKLLCLSQTENLPEKAVPKRVLSTEAKVPRKPAVHRNGYSRTLPYNVLQRGGPHRILSAASETIALSGN